MPEAARPVEPGPLPSSAGPSVRLAREGLAFWGSRLAVLAAMFGWQVALARELGPAAYGVYGAIGALLVVSAVLPDFGLGLVVARDTAREPASAPRILAASLAIQPSLAILAAVLVTSAGWKLGFASGASLLLPLAALSLVTDTLGNVCHAQFIGAGRLWAPSAISMVHALVLVGAGGILLLRGFGLWGVYCAILGASVVRAALYRYQLGRSGVRAAWPASSSVVRGLLREGWPIALLGLVGLGRLHADKLVVLPVLGSEATGQLQAAFVVVFGTVDLVNGTLLTAVFPAMARAAHGDSPGRLVGQVERLSCFALLAGVPLALGGAVFAGRACRLVLGPGFGETPRLIGLFLSAAVATMVGNVLAQTLVVEGRQQTLLAIRTTVLAFFLVLLVALVNRVGLAGAALAALVSEVAGLGLLGWAVRLPGSAWRRLTGSALRIFLAAAASAGAARIVDPASGIRAFVAMAVVYAAAVALLRVVRPEEWLFLRGALRGPAGGAARG